MTSGKAKVSQPQKGPVHDSTTATLLERLGSLLSKKDKTARELNDAEFLALFDIPEVKNTLGRGYNIKSIGALVDYYRQRVGADWLEPPRLLTDIHLDTANASDSDIVNRADELLESRFAELCEASVDLDDGELDWLGAQARSDQQQLRINRHSWWPLLGQAYLISRNERYAKIFSRQLSSWINTNFPLPRHYDQNPIWSSDQVAYRLRVSWIPAFGMFYESPYFNTGRKMDMLKCIYDQARLLKKANLSDSSLLDGGLVSAGISFPELDEASIWRKTAVNRFRRGATTADSESSDLFWSWNVLASSDRELAQAYC